jgi:hypothetical protein
MAVLALTARQLGATQNDSGSQGTLPPVQTTRDLMTQMETDLGTKLDWIAVDHHNSGHPHTHILVRGLTEDGKTLNIAGDYIAYGIRERASEIVTRELGRQTELEVTKQLEREVDAARAEEVGRGMLVAAGSAPTGPRAADRNIINVAGEGGVYRPSQHLERARAAIDRIGGDPQGFVRAHVRWLEALRRAGHAERIDADHWRVPSDLPARGQAYDLARDRANIRISILSPAGLDQQVGHDGATWLDRELVSRQRIALGLSIGANHGVGRNVEPFSDGPAKHG